MTKILSDDIISDLEGKITEDTPTVQKMMNYAGDNSLAFGLGGKAKDISGQDLNNLSQRTGFYTGNNLTNAPFADAWYVTQIVYNNSNIVQIARTVYSNANIYQRIKSWENSTQSATWKPWAKIISNNQSGSVTTNMLADNAVTAAKADVAAIMNSAGTNKQLFGLGGACLNVSSQNLNSIQRKTGFYMGSSLTNAPEAADPNSWWYIEQLVHNDNYVVQIASSFSSHNKKYRRILSNGTWSSWVLELTQENAYNANAFISSNPNAIGKWVDGKTIWRKRATFTPTQMSAAYSSGLSNVNAIIKMYGFFKSSNYWNILPCTVKDWEAYLYDYNVSDNTFKVSFGSAQWNRGVSSINVIIEYIVN